MLKLIDLFAGAGGLSNGFEQTGRFNVVAAVELNEAALNTFKKNHQGKNADEIETHHDITKLDFSKLECVKNISKDELVIIGGPPCQGFSNANRQKNYLISGNNQLVKEYVRAIRQVKPIAFVMENVVGIQSDKHKFFITNGNLQLANGEYDKYSTEQYLTNELNVPLEELSLTLLSTTITDECFVHALNKIIDEHSEIAPFINYKEHVLLSRLRTLQRRLKNSTYIIAKDNLEAKNYEHIAVLIHNQKTLFPFTEEVASIFKKLSSGEKLSSDDIKYEIQKFIELNLLLMHLEELKNEDIRYTINKLEKKNDVRIISANVMSYKVIDFLIEAFKNEGYSIGKGILNAIDFGVPQHRNRFILMGVKETVLDESKKVNIPSPLNLKKPNTVWDAIGSLLDYFPETNVEDDVLFEIPLSVRKQTSSRLEGYYTEGFTQTKVRNHINTANRETSLKRFQALEQGQNFHDLSDDLKTNYTDSSRTQNTVYMRLKSEEPSRTVVNVRKSMWVHPTVNRSISIREAARLQTFPDSFHFIGRKDEQYQQIGNAVPPLLARAIAEKLLQLLDESPERFLTDDLEISLQKVPN